jgi:hypothetical protein
VCLSEILHLKLSTNCSQKIGHSSKTPNWFSPELFASAESAHTNLFLEIKSLKLKPNLQLTQTYKIKKENQTCTILSI